MLHGFNLQCFLDWRSETKRKALELKKGRGSTGLGKLKANVRPLNDLEVICFNEFLTVLALEGDQQVDDGLEVSTLIPIIFNIFLS